MLPLMPAHTTAPAPCNAMQAGVEEYWDYIFPEEAGAAPHLKLLELAYKHKRQKLDTEGQ